MTLVEYLYDRKVYSMAVPILRESHIYLTGYLTGRASVKLFELGVRKATYKEKLPQLGYTMLLLSSDTAYQAQGCSVVLHVVESADETIM